ncbi:MAG: O-antigen ligase family protein [Pseudomonadota bacterium]
MPWQNLNPLLNLRCLVWVIADMGQKLTDSSISDARSDRSGVLPISQMLSLKVAPIWAHFKVQNASFWMVSCYLLFEYLRPQSIFKGLDFLPWMQIFIMLALGLRLIEPRDQRAEPTALGKWLVLYFVIILISGALAFSPSHAWEKLNLFYIWLCIMLMFRHTVYDQRNFLILLIIFFLANWKMSTFGARTFAMRGFSFTGWGLNGPPGYFTNSSEYAAQMSVFFAFSWYFYLALKPHVSRLLTYVLISAPITAFLSVLGASSRGAQLAVLVQSYFMFVHGKIRVTTLIGAAAVLYVGLTLLPDEQMERFSRMGEDKTSIQRLLYWEHGWDMMLEYPAFGVGYFNFVPYYESFYPEDMLYSNAQLAHNIFVQVGADLGFIGLACYMVLILFGFSLPRRAIKRLRALDQYDDWRIPVAKGLMVSFLGFLVSGQFVSIVYYPYMWIHLGLCFALWNSTRRPQINVERGRQAA